MTSLNVQNCAAKQLAALVPLAVLNILWRRLLLIRVQTKENCIRSVKYTAYVVRPLSARKDSYWPNVFSGESPYMFSMTFCVLSSQGNSRIFNLTESWQLDISQNLLYLVIFVKFITVNPKRTGSGLFPFSSTRKCRQNLDPKWEYNTVSNQ